MKRNRFDESQDQRIADEHTAPPRGYTPELMCAAKGCPNRWTVQREGVRGLCSVHDRAWDEPHDWPALTEQQQREETDRAEAFDDVRGPKAPLTAADKTAILQRLRGLVQDFGKPADPKAWARQLKARDESGERLTRQQRDAWRTALAAELRPSAEDVQP